MGGTATVNDVDSLFRAKKPMDAMFAASTQIAKTINPTNSIVTISHVDNLNPGFYQTQSGSKGLLSSANSIHLDLNNVDREQPFPDEFIHDDVPMEDLNRLSKYLSVGPIKTAAGDKPVINRRMKDEIN